MSDMHRLLAEYIEVHQRDGDADPGPFLERAARSERRGLAALIDGYLARAPRRTFDASAFRGSAAEATVEALERSMAGASGLWPALLPRLRARAGLKRRELVDRLAEALGVGDKRAKVERYYHEMELGLLPTSGVSDRVLDALAKLVGSTAAELRDAGTAASMREVLAQRIPTAFARMDIDADAYMAPPPPPTDAAREEGGLDEVDELFRGGG